MEGIFKKVLNSSYPRRADKKALTLYFIRECSMSSEIWKVSRIPVSGNKVLLSLFRCRFAKRRGLLLNRTGRNQVIFGET